MKIRLVLPIAFSALYVSSAFGQAPPSLTVKSATSTQVQLTWSVSDGTQTFTVQRKSGGDYSTIATITGTIATDSNIDPYTIYTYRVVAANATGQPSPSNEVTVGPPPTGFNLALAGPASDSNAA